MRCVHLGLLNGPLQLGDSWSESAVPLPRPDVPHDRVNRFFDSRLRGSRTIGPEPTENTVRSR